MIEIKDRWNGTVVLYSSDTATNTLEAVKEAIAKRADLRGAYLRGADFQGADLQGASLRGADFQGANLRGTNLRGTNLRGTNLQGADLQGANIRSADLRGAYLQDAKGINKYLTTPLYAALYTDGQITAFKLSKPDGSGPHHAGLTCAVGAVLSVYNANTDESQQCAEGINVASLDWICREWQSGYRIWKVTHTREDIAAIPVGSDGKYRLHRCTVVAEIPASELGLGVEEPAEVKK